MAIQFPEKFNMADYFLYHNVEKGRADKTCLYYQDQTYTYGDAVRWSNRAGNALRECGMRVEDRVLLVMPDCPEFAWTWFGTSQAGGVITMVNPLLMPDDYRYYLEYTRASVAVVHESVLPNFTAVAQNAKYLRNVLVTGNEAGDFLSFKDTLAQMPDEQRRGMERSARRRALEFDWGAFVDPLDNHLDGYRPVELGAAVSW